MKTKYVVLAALAGLSLAALGACHDAIFATIEKEQKVATNTLSQTLSIYGIAATTTADQYYVAAGGVFQGNLSPAVQGTINWTPNSNDSSRPFNPSGMLCNALAFFGGNLYGGFFDSSGTPGFYNSTEPPTSWSPILPVHAGEQVTILQATPTLLFKASATPSGSSWTYELDYSSDGTTWAPCTNLTGQTSGIVGVGYDNADFIWAATTTAVYKSSAAFGTTFNPLLTAPGVGSDPIRGLFVDSTYGVVFVTTKTRGIFFTKDGGTTWSNVSDDSPSGGTGSAGFLAVGGPVDPAGSHTTYLAGSDLFGYYTLSVSGSGSLSRFGDTTITLYSSSVSQILVDNVGGQLNVFLGTHGNGLWRAAFNPSTGDVLTGTNEYWIHE
jgi:hypothetical protein